MTELPNTSVSRQLINDFISETRGRLAKGQDLTFTKKALLELESLNLEYDITEDDIQDAIMNLNVRDYFRGADLSGNEDFNVCAFRVLVGEDNIEIYLKYGLLVDGVEILLFSNHIPIRPMVQPFNN